MFLGVCGEVLDAGAYVPTLDTVYVGGGHLTGEIRILGEILEVPSAQGGALDVHGRTQHHAKLLVLAAVADGLAHAADQLPVEGSGGGTGRGHTDRFDAVIDTQMIRLLVLLAQAVGAVTDHGGGNAQPLHGFGVPEVQTGAKPRLFFQGHLRNKCFHIH